MLQVLSDGRHVLVAMPNGDDRLFSWETHTDAVEFRRVVCDANRLRMPNLNGLALPFWRQIDRTPLYDNP